jgi:hypothetical protein
MSLVACNIDNFLWRVLHRIVKSRGILMKGGKEEGGDFQLLEGMSLSLPGDLRRYYWDEMSFKAVARCVPPVALCGQKNEIWISKKMQPAHRQPQRRRREPQRLMPFLTRQIDIRIF